MRQERLAQAVQAIRSASSLVLACHVRPDADALGSLLGLKLGLEKLGKQTNAALDALAKSQAARPAVQTNFAEDYSKEGISYTVQKGDSLASIAKKTGAKQQDIINANKLSDPSRIAVGQTLFIPGGK